MLLMLRSAPGRTLCIGLIGAGAFWKLLAASLFLTQSVWIRLTEPLMLILAGFLLLLVRYAMSRVPAAGEITLKHSKPTGIGSAQAAKATSDRFVNVTRTPSASTDRPAC